MIGDRKTNGGLHSDRNIKPSFSDSTSTGIKGLAGSDLRKNIHVIYILETSGRFEGNERKKVPDKLPSTCFCCSVAKLCPTLCDPMDCSTPGFPALHYPLEFAQIHVHRVSDAI